MSHVLDRRRAGMLCAVRSVPAGEHERFLDFMASAGIGIWQILPLNPPDAHQSPYSSSSLFALDSRLARVWRARASESVGEPEWLREVSRFVVARDLFDTPWTTWPAHLRDRRRGALIEFDAATAVPRSGVARAQHQADAAWAGLKRAANDRGILVMGDMPLYPAHDSADVWADRALFELDQDGEPRECAGVPPDYFSADGQRWGNPLYRWPVHEASGFDWWVRRVLRQLEWFDVLRVDHFRGLQAYWAIPRGHSAAAGHWRPAPGRALLSALGATVRERLVAEDLGVVTPAVEALRDEFGLPGMRVLQFAFDGKPNNPHLPRNCPAHSVVYSGTHDNDTSFGWYLSLSATGRRRVQSELGETAGEWPWPLIDAALLSPARTAVIPLQDFLGLGSEARMNTPGTMAGNWHWQVDPAALTPDLARRIRDRVAASDRLQDDAG